MDRVCMNHPATAPLNGLHTPTLCLDCGQSFFGPDQCPHCCENQHRNSPPPPGPGAEKEITLPDTPEQTAPAKLNPTICLDCGQTFIGTIECPSCSASAKSPGDPEVSSPDRPVEESKPLETEALFSEMEELGFQVTPVS